MIPKQAEGNGLDAEKVQFTDDGILEVIRHYTREAGVRSLERQIGSCLRKVARKFVDSELSENFKEVIDAEKVRELLGTILYRKQDIATQKRGRFGQWTWHGPKSAATFCRLKRPW